MRHLAIALAKEACEQGKVAVGSAASAASAPATSAKAATATVEPATSTPSPTRPAVSRKLPAASPEVSTTNPVARVPSASPIGLLESCPGVRPGAIVQSDTGSTCTFNFVFTDGIRHYIGTAGHCVLPVPSISTSAEESPPVVEQTWLPGSGPVAQDVEGNRIGEFAYGLMETPLDFGLIRLDPGVPFSAQMCHFGGPTGVNNDLTSEMVPLHYYGNATGIGTVAPARTAFALDMRDPNVVSAVGVAFFGDSGAGVIGPDGRAVGLVRGSDLGSIQGNGDLLSQQRIIRIPRMAPQIARAEQALNVNLELVTAPLE